MPTQPISFPFCVLVQSSTTETELSQNKSISGGEKNLTVESKESKGVFHAGEEGQKLEMELA